MRRRPPSSTLFPYTTLFRSAGRPVHPAALRVGAGEVHDLPRESCGVLRSPLGHERGRPSEIVGVWKSRSEEHTSELQSLAYLVCRLLLEKKKNTKNKNKQHK